MGEGKGIIVAKKDKKKEEEKPKEPTALEKELAGFDSIKKAALLMRVLGEQQASEIIGYLNREEVEKLGTAMVDVGDVTQGAVDGVLDDVIGQLRGQTNLGLGSKDYVEGVLKRALGPEKSASVLSRILPSASSKGLEILAWMTPLNIYEMIGDEHPQVIAIILSVLEEDTAVEVLEFLPKEMRAEVVRRVALLDTVQPGAISELENVVQRQLETNLESQAAPLVGGAKAAASIMNRASLDLNNEIFGEIGEIDESLKDQIQGFMFEFEDFLKTSSRDMQTLGQAIDQEELKVAFRGSSDAVINHFLDNLSERVAELIRDDMEIAQPKPVSEVMEARNNIIAQARKLQDAGEIIMSAGDSADYL